MSEVASGKAINNAQLATLVAGSDGTNTVFLKVNSAGALALIPGTGATDLGKAEDAAHASGDVGVMMLGVRSDSGTTTLSGTDGDYTPPALTLRGIALSSIGSAANIADAALGVGAFDVSSNNNRFVAVANGLLNGTTWDRARNNIEATALASAARTATTASADQTNYNGKLVVVVVNVTVWTADAITPAIQGKDPISGNYFQLHANFTAISATGTYVYVVGLSTLTAAAGGITAVAQAPVPRTWRVNMTHAGATTTTYSVAAITLL